MTTQHLLFQCDSGLTLTIDVIKADGSSALQQNIAATELQISATGIATYRADFTAIAASQVVQVNAKLGAEILAYGFAWLTGVDGNIIHVENSYFEALQEGTGGGGGGGNNPAANVYVVVNPDIAKNSQVPYQITVYRGDTLQIAVPPLGTITGWTRIVFTAKSDLDQDDSESIIQVEVIAAGGGGLLYVEGSPATDSSQAALTVNDEMLGTLDLYISAEISKTLQAYSQAYWDCQWFWDSGDKTPSKGRFVVTKDVTRTT